MATGFRLRVTTTGSLLLAFRNVLKLAWTSAADALVMFPPRLGADLAFLGETRLVQRRRRPEAETGAALPLLLGCVPRATAVPR
jgi:hypothetical protein